MTKTLRRRLGEIVNEKNALREFALTSDYNNGFSIIEVENLSKEFIEQKTSKENQETPPRIDLRVSVETERKGMQKVLLKVKVPWSENAELAGNPNELLSSVNWNLELKNGDKEEKNVRYPNLKLIGQEIKNDVAELTFETGWTKEAGEFGWRIYRLTGKFDTNQSVLPWVKEWSTQVDTTADVANKTLNLDGALGNLWKNGSLKNETVGGACIRVGKR